MFSLIQELLGISLENYNATSSIIQISGALIVLFFVFLISFVFQFIFSLFRS